jgi:hypothetical protein
MVSADEALAVAEKQIQEFFNSGDLLFSHWSKGRLSDPVLVHNTFGDPSYWLVPLQAYGLVVGFVRVSGSGKVLATGTFCRDPENLSTCPKVATGISLKEVQRIVHKEITYAPDERAEAPIFVHDGPVGREAWLVSTVRSGKQLRWIFITAGGTYQRQAGTTLDESFEA